MGKVVNPYHLVSKIGNMSGKLLRNDNFQEK